MIAEKELTARELARELYVHYSQLNPQFGEFLVRLRGKKESMASRVESDYFKCRDAHHAELRKHGISPV